MFVVPVDVEAVSCRRRTIEIDDRGALSPIAVIGPLLDRPAFDAKRDFRWLILAVAEHAIADRIAAKIGPLPDDAEPLRLHGPCVIAAAA